MNFCKWFKGNNGYCFQIFVGLAILLGAFVITAMLIATKPAVPKTVAEPKPTLVEAVKAVAKKETIIVSAFGSVQEWRKVALKPEVTGKVIEQSTNLIVGGLFKKDDIMLKIDPRDYQSFIDQEQAALQRAEVELKLEKGRKIIAEREWELLDPAIQSSEIGEELALRRPQLLEKKAALNAAKSRLEKATIDLERTTLKAPFNALVLEESVDVGQVVNPQNPVATLVATDEFRILVSIPFSRLHWIEVPQQGGQGAKATIVQTIGDDETISREGYVVRLLGDLDPVGRMARLLIAIKDPMSLNNDLPPLLLDTYVRVDIEGPTLDNLIALPRKAIREGSQVWIDNKGKLEIRPAHILYGQKELVLIDEGIQDGEYVITSSIPVPIPGMNIRNISEK